MYNSAWRSFRTWAQARGALALPASPPLVAAYLAHLAYERGLSVATVRLHRAAGQADPTDDEPVRQIMKGIARARGKGRESAQLASWRARVDLALLATRRDGLLR